MRTVPALVLTAAVAMAPAQALAHPLLDEAQARFSEADFEGALAAYERAELADDLTADDLVELYLRRALVHHTMGDAEKLELDLFRLATLSPDHEFSREIPPVVQDAFSRVKQDNNVTGAVSAEVQATRAPGGIRVEAVVNGDLAAIVQTIRVGLRVPGNAWTTRDNAALEFPVTEDQSVEYYAVAIGPGGAILASDGTAEEPRTEVVQVLLDPSIEERRRILEEEEEQQTTSVALWPFLVGGAVAVVAGGVVAALLIVGGGQSDVTDLTCCTVEPE